MGLEEAESFKLLEGGDRCSPLGNQGLDLDPAQIEKNVLGRVLAQVTREIWRSLQGLAGRAGMCPTPGHSVTGPGCL